MRTITLLLIFAAVAPVFGKIHFSLDLFSHFKLHYLLLFLVCCAYFVLTRSYGWAAFAFAGALLNFAFLVPWYVPGGSAGKAEDCDSVRILLSNVSMHNRDPARLIELVRFEQPAVVGLVEVNQRWIDELGSLRDQYAFYVEYPHEAYRGLALYSRYPISQSSIVEFGPSVAPSIVAEIDAGTVPFRILLTHPVPPMTDEWAKQRNRQIDGIAGFVEASDKPVVVLGDLNITMWDRTYVELVKRARLLNSRLGSGIGATWPALPVLGIPIDHILVTAPSAAGAFRVHDSIGSDHFPVSATVVPKSVQQSADEGGRRQSHGQNCSAIADQSGGAEPKQTGSDHSAFQ